MEVWRFTGEITGKKEKALGKLNSRKKIVKLISLKIEDLDKKFPFGFDIHRWKILHFSQLIFIHSSANFCWCLENFHSTFQSLKIMQKLQKKNFCLRCKISTLLSTENILLFTFPFVFRFASVWTQPLCRFCNVSTSNATLKVISFIHIPALNIPKRFQLLIFLQHKNWNNKIEMIEKENGKRKTHELKIFHCEIIFNLGYKKCVKLWQGTMNEGNCGKGRIKRKP